MSERDGTDALPQLRGAVDAMPEPTALAGWARSPVAVPGAAAVVVVMEVATGERLGRAQVTLPRPDIGADCGFLVRLKRAVTVEELRSEQVVVLARYPNGPQAPLRIFPGLQDPTRELLGLTAGFFGHCRERGVTLNLGHGRGWSDLALEAPLSLATRHLGRRVSVGAFTGIYGHGVGFLAETEIGRFCSIADGFCIGPDDHPQNYLSSSMVQYVPDVHGWDSFLEASGSPRQAPLVGFPQRGGVSIGNDVWIGANVMIRRGVTIGDGAVVAAGAVVVADVPPYTVVAGVPARPLRQRFPDGLVARLLELRWWNYNVLAVPGLRFDRPVEAVTTLERMLDDGLLRPLALQRHTLGGLHAEWSAPAAAAVPAEAPAAAAAPQPARSDEARQPVRSGEVRQPARSGEAPRAARSDAVPRPARSGEPRQPARSGEAPRPARSSEARQQARAAARAARPERARQGGSAAGRESRAGGTSVEGDPGLGSPHKE